MESDCIRYEPVPDYLVIGWYENDPRKYDSLRTYLSKPKVPIMSGGYDQNGHYAFVDQTAFNIQSRS